MSRNVPHRVLLLGTLALLAVGTAARADISLSSTGWTTNAGQTTYTFDVFLLSGSDLMSPPLPTTSDAGITQNPYDFFTVYDIPGLVGTPTFSAANWTATTQPTGINPPAVAPPDDAGIPNVTFRYTGPTIANPLDPANPDASSPLLLGSLSIVSANDLNGNSLYYTGATQKDVVGGVTNGDPANNVSTVGIQAVPEPATIASGLLGLGLFLAAGLRSRRRPLA